MKTLITSAVLSALLSTAAMAEITPPTSQPKCSNTDIVVGATGAVVLTTVIALTTVRSLPLMGPGIAAGTTLGLTGAFSMPYLTGTTVPVFVASYAIGVPWFGAVGYYASCVYNNM
jgi:hypothetical protein